MPAAQALAWTIEGARDSFKWLKELQDQWEEARVKNKDGSSFRKKQRIMSNFLIIVRFYFRSEP